MSLSKRNCIESNSDVPANHVEMRREVSLSEYECPLVYSHGALLARPMCCSEPNDVPFLFEFVRMWSSYTIKQLLRRVR